MFQSTVGEVVSRRNAETRCTQPVAEIRNPPAGEAHLGRVDAGHGARDGRFQIETEKHSGPLSASHQSDVFVVGWVPGGPLTGSRCSNRECQFPKISGSDIQSRSTQSNLALCMYSL